MALLYDRKEDREKVVIVYKYQAAWFLFLLGFLISIPFTKGYEIIMTTLLVVVFVIHVFGRLKPNREIHKAMKHGILQVSGSRFSFKKPITFTIMKGKG